jgi:signal transduction histidine kinase
VETIAREQDEQARGGCVTRWNENAERLLAITARADPARSPSCTWRRNPLNRPRDAAIVFGTALLIGGGVSAFIWYGQITPLVAALASSAVTAVILTRLWARSVGRQRLAAARLLRSKRRLQRRNLLLQSTLENIGEGLSVFDGRGRLIAWNSRFCELLDLPAAAVTNATLREVLMLQAVRGDFGNGEPKREVAERLELFYRDVPTTKERITPVGRLLQIRRRAMPNGAVVSVYSDVTEIKASERKLIEARSQAELANRAKGDFLANMSHELRTPLNAIIGFSEVISNELFGPIENEKYLEYIRDIHASSLHLLSIINDVLDMSKIEAGKVELAQEVVSVQSLLGEVIRMVHERAQSRDIKLIESMSKDKIDIWADERSMKQIFLNLLSNAIKFSKEGGTVEVRVAADQPDTAVFEIEDHGIGMSEEEQERALQPFGQAQPATTRTYGGTGLGLPITKGLVEAHGGTLAITSCAGLGTTVRVVLPREHKRSVSISF